MSLIPIERDDALGVSLEQSSLANGYWIFVRDALGTWHAALYGLTLDLAQRDYAYVRAILAIRGAPDCVRGKPEPMEQSR